MAENNLNLSSEESDDQDIPVSRAITKFNKKNNTTKRKLHKFSSSNDVLTVILSFNYNK
jgi:hypothetical protein